MKKTFSKEKVNILIAPLDWGLGHAMRCIPLIKELSESGFNVILAADGRPYDLLHTEFPNLEIIRLPGQKIIYSQKNSFVKMMKVVPAFYRMIKKEHKMLESLIHKHNLHAVISDNRYGLYSHKVPSVFIGHQMMIKMPVFLKWTEWFIRKLNLRFINRFTECWIPDYKDNKGLSGDLAHKYSLPGHFYFIGPLSRFNNENTGFKINKASPGSDLLFILSGPEPQRTILEEKILSQLQSINRQATIVRGVTEKNRNYHIDTQTRIIDHADTSQLWKLIKEAEIVICRSGYSSIMDLSATGKRAIFIPTPGQTEQEYLAKYFYKKRIFYYEPQKSLNISEALKNVKTYPGIQTVYDPAFLRKRINKLAEKAKA
ncbi:MAG: glycosyltransferase [Bacteroidota bacterium]